MPQRKAAKKDLRKNIKRRAFNLKFKKKLTKTIKEFKKAIVAKDINASQLALKKVYKLLDKAASKNIIHYKKADRKKSKLAKLLNTIKSK